MSEVENSMWDAINYIAQKHDKAIEACEAAYLFMLDLPMGELRLKADHIMANLRDALAVSAGHSPERIQEHYENYKESDIDIYRSLTSNS